MNKGKYSTQVAFILATVYIAPVFRVVERLRARYIHLWVPCSYACHSLDDIEFMNFALFFFPRGLDATMARTRIPTIAVAKIQHEFEGM